jgi:hyaluronan synthase
MFDAQQSILLERQERRRDAGSMIYRKGNAAPPVSRVPGPDVAGLRIPTLAERTLAVVLFAIAAAAALRFSHGVYWYGAVALGMVGVKLGAAVFYRTVPRPPIPSATVAAVVPFFNEDPVALLRCIDSLRKQTMPLDEIWIIDDGSADPSAFYIARAALADLPEAVVLRYENNRGKRHAQAHAFRRTRCELILTVDSDTVLEPHAMAELAREFSDPQVQAATGSVRALNPDTNLLTRLTDLRYANAFLYERAAYSRVGSVLCCCGSLSMYRTAVIIDNLEDFVTQTFLGVEVQFGDDRRLTNYALLRGESSLSRVRSATPSSRSGSLTTRVSRSVGTSPSSASRCGSSASCRHAPGPGSSHWSNSQPGFCSLSGWPRQC